MRSQEHKLLRRDVINDIQRLKIKRHLSKQTIYEFVTDAGHSWLNAFLKSSDVHYA